MIYFLMGWLLLLGLSSLMGDLVLTELNLFSPEEEDDRKLLSIWLGMSAIALFLLSLSLIMPLTPLVGIGVSGLIVAIGCWRQCSGAMAWTWTVNRMLGVTLMGVSVAAWCDRPVTWHDTGYYHYSLIQWLGQYGTVPGLALIFNHLGLTSAWFALATPFNPVYFAGRPLALTNGFVFLLLMGQFLIGLKGLQLRQSQANVYRLADVYSVVWGALLIPITLFLDPLSKILLSASPDLVVTVLVGVINWWILLSFDRPPQTRPEQNHRIVPLLLAIAAVNFKLIALPLLLVAGVLSLWRQPLWVQMRNGAIGLLLLLPILSGNLLTSGCPLYPSPLLCLDLPWSPSPGVVSEIAIATHGWTTWYGTPPPGANPWLWSLGQWFLSSPKEKITATGIAIAGMSALFVMQRAVRLEFAQAKGAKISKILQSIDRKGELWVSAIGFVGLAFIMSMSPFFRFSAPYILTLIALGLAILIRERSAKAPDLMAPSSLDPIQTLEPSNRISDRASNPFLALSVGFIALCFTIQSHALWLPPPMEYFSTWIPKITNGIAYQSPASGNVNAKDVPHKDMCWTAPIPCAYDIPPTVYLRDRDRGLAGGFVRR